jgi:Fanconi anemia group M protein
MSINNETQNRTKLIVKIKMDLREDDSQIGDILMKKYNIPVEKVMLPTGDYVIDDEIVVERKTSRDFVQSIIDGRLFKQSQKMNKFFDLALFIIEEENLYTCGIDIHPHAVKGALVSVAIRWRIPILFTKDREETASLLWLIATQQHEVKKELTFRHGYRPKTYRKRQLYILQGLPQVGPKLSDRLLNHFGSVEKVFTAKEEELVKVNNLGKKKAEKIRMLLREKRAKYKNPI